MRSVPLNTLALQRLYHWEKEAPERVVLTQPMGQGVVQAYTWAQVADQVRRMAAHLKAAGFKDSEITLFPDPAHPKEGGMVAVLPGSDPKAKPILLLAHMDVVEAKREDWTRDPFKLIEEDGYFYGRGASDMKNGDVAMTMALLKLKIFCPMALPKKSGKMQGSWLKSSAQMGDLF